jgi:hypothetical protein
MTIITDQSIVVEGAPIRKRGGRRAGAGAPTKAPEEKRGALLKVRVRAADLERWKIAARAEGVSLARWVRARLG